jgi:hypothetical protein
LVLPLEVIGPFLLLFVVRFHDLLLDFEAVYRPDVAALGQTEKDEKFVKMFG